MVPLRHAARAAGLIDLPVPQAVGRWVRRRGAPRTRALDLALHLGYGAAWGVLLGLVPHPRARHGAALGAVQWAIGFLGILPALRVTRPAWRASRAENAVNVTAHLIYGAITGLVAREVAEPPSDAGTRVG
jgi:hypothetical protein